MSSHCPRIVLQRDVTLQDLVTLGKALGGKLLKRCEGGIDLSDGTGRRDIRFQTGRDDVSFGLDADGNFNSSLETVWLRAGNDLFDASSPLRIQAIDQPLFTLDEIAVIVDCTAAAFGARPSVIHNRLDAAGTKLGSLAELLSNNSDADINDALLFDFKAAVAKFTRPDSSGILEEREFECWMCQSWLSSRGFILDAQAGGMSDSIFDKCEFVTVLGRRVYQPRTACERCVYNFAREAHPQKRKRTATAQAEKTGCA